MNSKEDRRLSKFVSLVLRHSPDAVGLKLDERGWVGVEDLLDACRRHGRAISRSDLLNLVRTSEKQRFEMSDDRTRIRAAYGHSVDIDPGYEPTVPPDILFHGTASGSLKSVRREGLLPGKRIYVHLTETSEQAVEVGSRHGTPVLLKVRAGQMHNAGHIFYPVADRIWLVKRVPREFIDF